MDREDTRKEHQRIAAAIPPGPWHARGNTVLAGTETVAVVFARSASLVAHYLSKFPAYLEQVTDAEIDGADALEKAQARIEELEEKLEDMSADLSTAKDDAEALRIDLAEAQKALDDRLAGK